jgi:hypothetical protein
LFKFCEPPNFRIDSINDSCEVPDVERKRSLLLVDAIGFVSTFVDGTVSVRTVVVVVVSPSLPKRRIVRYSVIVLPNGFGASIGGAPEPVVEMDVV